MLTSKREYRVAIAYLRPPESDTTPGMSGTFEHIGIQFLKAAIQDLCPVRLVDGYAQNLRAPQVLEHIVAFDPDFVGFSPTVETTREILRLCRTLKASRPGIHICLGGHHATLCAASILANEPDVDSIVMGGDGEETLRELVQRLIDGRSFAGVPGVACRTNGAVSIGPARSLLKDLNQVRTAVRDTIAEISKTLWDGSVRMSTSRGCVLGKCTFCTVPDIYGACWRAFSAQRVLDEIDALYRTHEVKFLWISDDQFVNAIPESIQRAKDIARGLIDRNYNLYIRLMARPDDYLRDPEMIPLLKKAGWRVALVGFEAGNNRTLKHWKKGLTKNRNKEFARALNSHGIEIQAGFIMFDPTNTRDEIVENVEFLHEVLETRFLANLVRRLRMLPGTQIYRDYLARGFVSKDFDYRTSSYDYHFGDEQVGSFALWIDRVYMRNKKYDDTNWSLLNMHVPIFIEKMQEHGVPKADVDRLIAAKAGTERELRELNYEFFCSSFASHLKGETPASKAFDLSLHALSDRLAATFADAYAKHSAAVRYPFKRVQFTHAGYTEVIF